MSPQCNDKGKKNYLIEKIHSQRFDTHEISQILIKSTPFHLTRRKKYVPTNIFPT